MSDKPERRQEFAGQAKHRSVFRSVAKAALTQSKFCLLHHEKAGDGFQQ